jgi:hypothetical protein
LTSPGNGAVWQDHNERGRKCIKYFDFVHEASASTIGQALGLERRSQHVERHKDVPEGRFVNFFTRFQRGCDQAFGSARELIIARDADDSRWCGTWIIENGSDHPRAPAQ